MDLFICLKCKGIPSNSMVQCKRCKRWWYGKCAEMKENKRQNVLWNNYTLSLTKNKLSSYIDWTIYKYI